MAKKAIGIAYLVFILFLIYLLIKLSSSIIGFIVGAPLVMFILLLLVLLFLYGSYRLLSWAFGS